MSIESVTPSNPLILCCPLLLLPSILPSFRVFSNESVLHIRWPKYWSFSFSIRLSNEHPGLISFRMDWLDLLAIQGTLKSLLQYHSSKASIPWRSVFFMLSFHHGSFCQVGLLMSLDCKEIQAVHPKGNQSWVFIGKTEVEAETPIPWPPDAKS